MGLGPYIVMAWLGVIVASLVVAGLHLARTRAKGVRPALAAIMGAVLSGALVSAYLGACELDGYVQSRTFAISLVVGILGILLLALSSARLKRRPAVPAHED